MKDENTINYMHSGTEVDIFPYLKDLAAKWKLIATVTVICFSIAGVVSLIIPPVYRAESIVMPANEESPAGSLSSLAEQFGGIASIAGLGLSTSSGVKEMALALLQSKNFLIGFIEHEDLLPILFEDEWDGEKKEWKVSDPSDIPTVLDGVEEIMDELLEISEDSELGTITIAVKWKDRELAAHWANLLVLMVNSKMREEAIKEANTNISYLNQELQKTSIVPLKTAIYSMIELEIRNRMLANVRKEYALITIDPAIAPDEDDYFFPNRLLISILSAISAMIFMSLYVVIRRFAATIKH